MRRRKKRVSATEEAGAQRKVPKDPVGVRLRRRVMDVFLAIVGTRIAEVKFSKLTERVRLWVPGAAEDFIGLLVKLGNAVPWGTLLWVGWAIWAYANLDRLRSAGVPEVRKRVNASIVYEAIILECITIGFALSLDPVHAIWLFWISSVGIWSTYVVAVGGMRFGSAEEGGPGAAVRAWLRQVSPQPWRKKPSGWIFTMVLVLAVMTGGVCVPAKAGELVYRMVADEAATQTGKQDGTSSTSSSPSAAPEEPSIILITPPAGDAAPAKPVNGNSDYTG